MAEVHTKRYPDQLIVISGQVGVGKSTLARGLEHSLQGHLVSTRQLLQNIATNRQVVLASERRALQTFGETMDEESSGAWVATEVTSSLDALPGMPTYVVVDAIRTHAQLQALRESFPIPVTHIHLTAPVETLDLRYDKRESHLFAELSSYGDLALNATEASVPELGRSADVVIDTSRCSAGDVLSRAVATLRQGPSRHERLVDVYVGGQYGSEGKGNIAFHLAGEYDILVRVGGPNAGHKVPTQPPYTHRSLPSGSLANKRALLLIGPGATVSPQLLLDEIEHCGIDPERLSIDPRVMIIESADIEEEQGLVASIGSTGKGGGAAAARRIMGRHEGGKTPVRQAKDVPELAIYVRDTSAILERAYRTSQKIMLEGTQGTLLSILHGFYPWVTSRDTTAAACLSEAGIGIHRVRRVIMVVRTYPTRVGNPPKSTSGQMSQEIDWDVIADRSGLDEKTLRMNEKGSVSGSKRWVAEFDWALLRKAAELNGATDIALTFADYLDAKNSDAVRYDQLTPDTTQFIEEVGRVASAPVTLIATGFSNRALIDRRKW